MVTVKDILARAAVPALVVAALTAGLAACGRPGSGSAPGPAGPGAPSARPTPTGLALPAGTLCASPAAPDRVRVTRIPGLPLREPTKAGPVTNVVTITIASPARARILARAVCALPLFPGGLRCPLNVMGSYQLRFSSAGRRYPVVTLGTSGCEVVTGLGQSRWAGRAPGFWVTFARATGIGSPRHVP